MAQIAPPRTALLGVSRRIEAPLLVCLKIGGVAGRRSGGPRVRELAYWTIVTKVPSISLAVEITLELAWKPRSAVIMLVISLARSTFDISSSPPMVEPKPAVSGVPTIGVPELAVWPQSEPPRRSRPSSLVKVAKER